MGWFFILEADKKILDNDVATVVGALPKEFRGPFNVSKQDWGWSCAADVLKPKGKKLRISGAWFSHEISHAITKRIKQGLEKLGYKIINPYEQ